MKVILLVPTVIGMLLLLASIELLRRERLDPKFTAFALLVSGFVVISPLIYIVLDYVKSLFGIIYTFVLAFGLGILSVTVLVVYLILSIGKLRQETKELWQEVALMQAESGERTPAEIIEED